MLPQADTGLGRIPHSYAHSTLAPDGVNLDAVMARAGLCVERHCAPQSGTRDDRKLPIQHLPGLWYLVPYPLFPTSKTAQQSPRAGKRVTLSHTPRTEPPQPEVGEGTEGAIPK